MKCAIPLINWVKPTATPPAMVPAELGLTRAMASQKPIATARMAPMRAPVLALFQVTLTMRTLAEGYDDGHAPYVPCWPRSLQYARRLYLRLAAARPVMQRRGGPLARTARLRHLKPHWITVSREMLERKVIFQPRRVIVGISAGSRVVILVPRPEEGGEVVSPERNHEASVSANRIMTNSSATATRCPSTTSTADEAVARGSPVISSSKTVGMARRSSRTMPRRPSITPAGSFPSSSAVQAS